MRMQEILQAENLAADARDAHPDHFGSLALNRNPIRHTRFVSQRVSIVYFGAVRTVSLGSSTILRTPAGAAM